MNVDAMLQTLTVVQFFELKQYYEMEPRGVDRQDLHEARLLHLMYNLNVAKKDQKNLDAFLLKFESDVKKDEAPSEQQRMLAANTAAVMAFKMMAESGLVN